MKWFHCCFGLFNSGKNVHETMVQPISSQGSHVSELPQNHRFQTNEKSRTIVQDVEGGTRPQKAILFASVDDKNQGTVLD
jgi:hypothetical protein